MSPSEFEAARVSGLRESFPYLTDASARGAMRQADVLGYDVDEDFMAEFPTGIDPSTATDEEIAVVAAEIRDPGHTLHSAWVAGVREFEDESARALMAMPAVGQA